MSKVNFEVCQLLCFSVRMEKSEPLLRILYIIKSVNPHVTLVLLIRELCYF